MNIKKILTRARKQFRTVQQRMARANVAEIDRAIGQRDLKQARKNVRHLIKLESPPSPSDFEARIKFATELQTVCEMLQAIAAPTYQYGPAQRFPQVVEVSRQTFTTEEQKECAKLSSVLMKAQNRIDDRYREAARAAA